MIHAVIAGALLLQAGGSLPADSIESLARRARTAESRFERLSRSLAPPTFSSGGGRCDEIVGRFCLRFDSIAVPPADAEAAPVVAARREAVETLRRYFGAAPGARAAVGPLVRLLVLDGRPAEAASAAEAYGILSPDTLWAALLTGFAQHAAGRDSLAEEQFRRALAHMPLAEAADWQKPDWLLEPGERNRRRRLTDSGRADYDRRFWLHADPFWLTPQNEMRINQLSRRVESRLLSQVQTVAGMLSWGADLDELTARYGIARTRARLAGVGMGSPEMIEYYDTTQRAFAAASMRTGFAEPPLPGEKPGMYAAAARSAYVFAGASRVLHLDHQVTRFVRDGAVLLRVDGVVRRDSVLASDAGLAGLIVYDSTLSFRREMMASLRWVHDSAQVSLAVAVPQGRVIYSAEALDRTSRAASQARYTLDARIPATGAVLSDLLVCRPHAAGSEPHAQEDGALHALPSLVVTAGDTLGLFAEIYRAGSAVELEISMSPADPASMLGRAARWIGRTTGMTEESAYPRVAWRMTDVDGAMEPVALNLPMDRRLSGLVRVELKVTDSTSGQVTRTERVLLVKRR